jgi:hypothetical protein
LDLVSRSTTGAFADAEGKLSAISADGRFVLFGSSATNLVPDYSNPYPPGQGVPRYVYVHDRQLHTTTRVSASSLVVADVVAHGMSEDGNIIVYTGASSTTSGLDGTYLYNRTTNQTIQLATGGAPAVVSSNGRYASYYTAEPDGSGDYIRKFFRYDVLTGNTVQFADDLTIETLPSYLSPDGSYAVYNARVVGSNQNSIYVEHIESGQYERINENPGSSSYLGFSMSSDNRFLSYYTLVVGQPPATRGKAWVLDRSTGQHLLVDTGLNLRSDIQLRSDGSQVAFTSFSRMDGAGYQVFVASLGQADTEPPTITSAAFSTNPKPIAQTSVQLSATVTDGVSGVERAEYYDPVQDTWHQMTLATGIASASINTPSAAYPAGIYEFKVRVWDVAGNDATQTVPLYVYDTDSRVIGMGSLMPGGGTSDPGDTLPTVTGNNVRGNFSLIITYTGGGSAPIGSSTFTYGSNCVLPWSNCFKVTTNSLAWLIAPDDSGTAILQGTASVSLGNQNLGSGLTFRITVTEGEGGAPDHYLLRIYEVNTDPAVAPPLYQASGDLVSGSILVQS